MNISNLYRKLKISEIVNNSFTIEETKLILEIESYFHSLEKIEKNDNIEYRLGWGLELIFYYETNSVEFIPSSNFLKMFKYDITSENIKIAKFIFKKYSKLEFSRFSTYVSYSNYVVC